MLLIIFGKRSVLAVWQGFKYAYDVSNYVFKVVRQDNNKNVLGFYSTFFFSKWEYIFAQSYG